MTLDQFRATAPAAYGRIAALQRLLTFRYAEAVNYVTGLASGSVYDTVSAVNDGAAIGWIGTLPPGGFAGQSAPTAVVVYPPDYDKRNWPSWSAAMAVPTIDQLLAVTTNVALRVLPPTWQQLVPCGVRAP